MKCICNNCRFFHDADNTCWLHNRPTTSINNCSDWKGFMYYEQKKVQRDNEGIKG